MESGDTMRPESPPYQIIPSTSSDLKLAFNIPAQLTYQKKRRAASLILGLVIVAAMYAVFSGMGYFPRLRFQLPQGLWGHSPQRNISNANLPSHFLLPSGDRIPSIALGVWRAGRNEVQDAVKVALNTGYRHIDGAWIYGNEEAVGKAVKESLVPRESIWLTSKLWNTFHSPDLIEDALDDSLRQLGTDYLDLYLIHWPVATYPDKEGYDQELTANPYPTWQKLEEMVEKGKIRNIGLSNFNIPRIENLTANSLKIRPAVNQVELNFWNPQPELLKWSKEHNILLQAYSPLGSTQQVKETLALPEVKAIALELGIAPAQVIISWHIQRGTVVLPKSVTPSRIRENFQVIALPNHLFDMLEKTATSQKPHRVVNPSASWGLDFDIFDDYPGAAKPSNGEDGNKPTTESGNLNAREAVSIPLLARILRKRPELDGGAVGENYPGINGFEKRRGYGTVAGGGLSQRLEYAGRDFGERIDARELQKRPEYGGGAVGERIDTRELQKRPEYTGGAVGVGIDTRELQKRPEYGGG